MPRDELGGTPPGGSDEADYADSLLREAVDISEPSARVALGLVPGDVLLDRFIVERLAGKGGMGAIHRGTDVLTQEPVAIKVMASGRLGDSNRFAQEAVVLAELSHPAIVRYLAHGQTPEGMRFLAMEWLDGEDLAERLARSPLSLEESLALLRRACEGIAVAHARGIVHRDLKPSNLFLANRDPACTKVLDFGIARHQEGTRTLTQSGVVLGTVGYMSPEQAMGSRDVDARTDVFALGCVLFECLTGRAAFAGPNAVAVLAKVLREEPPMVSELRPGLGAALDALVARMLAKDRDARPNDTKAVLSALDTLVVAAGSESALARVADGLTGAELRIVSVVLAAPRSSRTPPSESTRDEMDAAMSRVRELTQQFGAEPVAMRGGGLLIVLAGRGAATDQASQAARCGLLLARLRPDLQIGVATGRAETTGRVPVGAAIDRAAELIAGARASRADVVVDELTRGLLDPSFDVGREGTRLVLIGQRMHVEAMRLLIGKPTPFVGRDKELGMLELTLRECIDDRVARAVLVTGPPGQGKSRLRYELVKKVRQRGDFNVLMARADPVGAGSAFMLARQLVRDAIGRREGGDPATTQQANLRAYVAAIFKGPDFARVADFLGELIGVPCSEPCLELRAARNDPQIMRTWLRRSFCEWISAECAQRPLLVVLEDLHWGDLPSVTYLGDALATLAAQPLMLLALARPEVHDAFPSLWAGAEMIEVPLNRLTPRAAERLVREALGDKLPAGVVSRITERAGGNAFYLEELIRRVADGDDQTLPETVLALVQSRLERLPPEARRVVRAASIFGETFWRAGIAETLGQARSANDLDAWLEALVQREVFEPRQESRFPVESEYKFRHGLLREAAYAMTTDMDRITGHALAGAWLERAGEKDALTLADHFERGGERARAIPWLLQGAHIQVDGGNLDAGVLLAERGIACGAEDVERGILRLAQAHAHCWRGAFPQAIAAGQEAMALLPVGSTRWFAAASSVLWAATFVGDQEGTARALQAVSSVPMAPEPSGPYGHSLFWVSQILVYVGQIEDARALVQRAEALESGADDSDLVFVMWLRVARAYLQIASDDLSGTFANLTEARALSARSGAVLGQAMVAQQLVTAVAETGHMERASAAAREAHALCEPIGLRLVIDWTRFFVARARVEVGGFEESCSTFREICNSADSRLVMRARLALSRTLLERGELDQAQRECAAVMERAHFPRDLAEALCVSALIELRRERFELALASSERGLEAATHGVVPGTRSNLLLTRAESLRALGRADEADAAIREARDRILQNASTLADVELRHSYLTHVAANARTLELASTWLGEGSA